eukprot:1140663-Pelagomonas_calceolata.AAC.1
MVPATLIRMRNEVDIPVLRKDLGRMKVGSSAWDRAHKESIRAALVAGRGASTIREKSGFYTEAKALMVPVGMQQLGGCGLVRNGKIISLKRSAKWCGMGKWLKIPETLPPPERHAAGAEGEGSMADAHEQQEQPLSVAAGAGGEGSMADGPQQQQQQLSPHCPEVIVMEDFPSKPTRQQHRQRAQHRRLTQQQKEHKQAKVCQPPQGPLEEGKRALDKGI